MAKILQFSKTKDVNVQKVEQFLDGLQSDEIKAQFRQAVLSGHSGDAASFLQTVFAGSPVGSERGPARRLLLCKEAIAVLGCQELSTKMAAEITGYLLIEIDGLPAESLVELTETFMDVIRSKDTTNGKAFELLPKTVSTLAAMETVKTEHGRMSGQEFKDHLLNNLCSCRWEAQCAIHLASIFREIPQSSDQIKFVINKLLRMLKHIEMQELPPLVYQLLLLASKGHKRAVLEGLTGFFGEQDRKMKSRCEEKDGRDGVVSTDFSTELLRHTEGTIILHITFSIKQDQELGREFIKFLKAGQQRDCSTVLAPFNVALALSVAQIHRFEEQIFDFLKSTILKSLKDAKRLRDSPWIADLVPIGSNVTKLLLETVENSLYGWDHVMQGLVQLGFSLMDSYGPRPGPFGGKAPDAPGTPATPNQQACRLGSEILLNLFTSQEGVRSDILEQILNRVVTSTAGSITQYIKLLSSMVSSAPQTVLDCMCKVREAFDYLGYLPVATAEGLLKAFQPLMRLNVTLKDSLMLVLRKSMFSRKGDARKIAVLGFLQILKHFRVYGSLPISQASQSFSMAASSSQVMVDVHGDRNQPANYEAIVCIEILGILRRCLMQQADIRQLLYEGLYEVLCRNSRLQGPIVDMLLKQFSRYYEGDEDATPPIRLQPCILAQGNNVFLGEPLAHLLQSLVQSLLRCQSTGSSRQRGEDWAEDDTEEEAFVDRDEILKRLRTTLESLTERMAGCELDDFQLDRSADFSTGSGVGVRNHLLAILLMGVHEVLLEYVFSKTSSSEFKTDDVHQLLELYKKYQHIADILREKGSKGKGVASNKAPRSLLSVACVADITAALYSDEMPAHQEGLDVLRENADFCRYIVSCALQKVEQMREKGQCDGPQGTHPDRLYQHLCSISSVFFQKFSTGLIVPEDRTKKNKSLAPLFLQGLSSAVSCVCTFFPDRLLDFLNCLDPSLGDDQNGGTVSLDDDEDAQEKVHLHIKKYQRLVIDVLSGGEDASSTMKDAIHLCHIMEALIKTLHPQNTQFAQVQAWISKVCTDNSIEDIGLCKVAVLMLFSLTSRIKSPLGLLRDLAEDVHSQIGDIDQDVEVEDRTHYAIVNSKTAAPTILLLWIQHADHVLDDTEWLVTRLKAEIQAAQMDVIDAVNQLATQREDAEKTICNQLGMLVTGYHELVQTSMPAGPCTDQLLKSLTKLYTILASLCKFYLAMYAQKCGQMSPRFEKLVKLSGTHLTQNVYALITYVQQLQTEKLSNMRAGGKATKDKGKGKKGDKKGPVVEEAMTVGKARTVMRETRPIPNLIFAIEQYEASLIKLSKRTKVDLLAGFKLSTSRDFRINTAVVQANMAEQASDSDEEMSDVEMDQPNGVGGGGDAGLGGEWEEMEADEEEEETQVMEEEEPGAKRKKTMSRNKAK